MNTELNASAKVAQATFDLMAIASKEVPLARERARAGKGIPDAVLGSQASGLTARGFFPLIAAERERAC